MKASHAAAKKQPMRVLPHLRRALPPPSLTLASFGPFTQERSQPVKLSETSAGACPPSVRWPKNLWKRARLCEPGKPS